MTPPEADGNGMNAGPDGPAAVSFFGVTESAVGGAGQVGAGPSETLLKRADFLRAASARRQGTPGFLLQARERGDATMPLRVGFTCSKKLGNAVMRNRAKRRLREIARAVLPGSGRRGWDYVLVGRPGATIDRAFSDLLNDLRVALLKVHDSPTRADGPTPQRGKRRGKGKPSVTLAGAGL